MVDQLRMGIDQISKHIKIMVSDHQKDSYREDKKNDPCGD